MIIKKKFNWKKKTAIYIGRFQPFHLGHKKLFLDGLKKNGQVAILVMDSQNVGNKKPLNINIVKKKLNQLLKNMRTDMLLLRFQ